jgi:propanediol utilization protein
MSRQQIPVKESERHVHLTQGIIEQLFCDKYRLHEAFKVSQPTQFAAQESVTLVGPRGRLAGVRVIGPPREENQVEISLTDAQALGVEAPVRQSGDLRDTPGIFVEGPRGAIRLDHGVIRALRHIHMHTVDADRGGLKDRDRIDVAKADANSHPLFFDVIVRVSSSCRSELHLDADEIRAAGLESGMYVTVLAKPRAR